MYAGEEVGSGLENDLPPPSQNEKCFIDVRLANQQQCG